METEITVRIMECEGYFIAKAVGYPGVISYGRSIDDVMSTIGEAWCVLSGPMYGRLSAAQIPANQKTFY